MSEFTSERQLDGTGTLALFLFVAVLDEREVEPDKPAQGETLPASIAALRQALGRVTPCGIPLTTDCWIRDTWTLTRHASKRAGLRKGLTSVFMSWTGSPACWRVIFPSA